MRSASSEKLLKSTIILFWFSGLVGLMGVLFLFNHISYFMKSVALLTAQGYDRSDILMQLIPDRLLPGIFEAVGLYFGLSALLLGSGLINQKLSTSSFEAAEAARAEKNALEAAKIFMSVDGLE